jgi:hypothetical protein
VSRDNKTACRCPYCDGPAEKEATICSPCSVKVAVCPDCGKPLPHGEQSCPDCSGRMKTAQGRKSK